MVGECVSLDLMVGGGKDFGCARPKLTSYVRFGGSLTDSVF